MHKSESVKFWLLYDCLCVCVFVCCFRKIQPKKIMYEDVIDVNKDEDDDQVLIG